MYIVREWGIEPHKHTPSTFQRKIDRLTASLLPHTGWCQLLQKRIPTHKGPFTCCHITRGLFSKVGANMGVRAFPLQSHYGVRAFRRCYTLMYVNCVKYH